MNVTSEILGGQAPPAAFSCVPGIPGLGPLTTVVQRFATIQTAIGLMFKTACISSLEHVSCLHSNN